MSRAEKAFLLVRAGSRRVGLELAYLIEVTQLGSVHPVPSAEPSVRGITAVHGRMVPVVHLGALLEGRAYPPATADLGVVVSVEGRRICLEVDEAEVLIREGSLPVPRGSSLPWAVGVARHADGLVPLLDLPAVSSRFMEAGAI